MIVNFTAPIKAFSAIGLLAFSFYSGATTLTTPVTNSLWVLTNEANQSAIAPIPAGITTNMNPSWGLAQ